MIELKSIHIPTRPIVDMMKNDETFGGVNGWMPVRIGIQIDPVQVDAHLICPVVAACHTVRIEHGYKLEDELTPEKFGAWICDAQNELEKPVEDERAGRLARMHATREHEDALSVEAKRPFAFRTIWKQNVRVKTWLTFRLHLRIGANREQIHSTLVQRIREKLAVIVDCVRVAFI